MVKQTIIQTLYKQVFKSSPQLKKNKDLNSLEEGNPELTVETEDKSGQEQQKEGTLANKAKMRILSRKCSRRS
jgi:hypothetical protein